MVNTVDHWQEVIRVKLLEAFHTALDFNRKLCLAIAGVGLSRDTAGGAPGQVGVLCLCLLSR